MLWVWELIIASFCTALAIGAFLLVKKVYYFFAGDKNRTENQKPPEKKMGSYFKYFYCDSCGYAVHDRSIKNVECCAKCGHEPMVRTVGRWEYKLFNNGLCSGYKAVKFHPKSKEGCDGER